jgi:hypothetical protein
MKSIELLFVAAISGAIGGAVVTFISGEHVRANEKSAKTLELDVLKVDRIILGTDLEIPSSVPNQNFPDFILNKNGISNLTYTFDEKKNISATFSMKLSPGEGLRLDYYDAEFPNLPALQSRISSSGLAIINGKIDQSMLTLAGDSISMTSKDRHILLKDDGLTCYRNSVTPCK